MAEHKYPDSVVVDTSSSRSAHLRPVPVNAVKLTDAFWAPRIKANAEITLPAQYQKCEETGRIDNFRRASGRKKNILFRGIFFNDSDVYKWLEAASWTLASGDNAEIARLADSAIDEIAAAQQADGYLMTFFMFENEKGRWADLKDKHEMYCAGHLIQAAVAHHRATGADALLNVARKLADHISAVFGPEEQGKRPGVCGHEEIEMALVELFRETGEQRYLEQARYFIEARGRGLIGGSPYHQDNKPIRELAMLEGHAVRALYYMCGAADVFAETGDASLLAALHRLHDGLVQKQMYITGGVGSRHEGEALGKPYELPNERAYAETCAAIANFMWNWRMLLIEANAKYADVMETALYNGVLSGLSLDGSNYFYVNPLADDGTHRRVPWFGCACCPPNIARTLASLPGYFYSVSREGIWVHLYAESEALVSLADGKTVGITQKTRYPWDGEIEVMLRDGGHFGLMLRIPCWCEKGASVEINGQAVKCAKEPGTYAVLRRDWNPGDVVKLSLPMPVRIIEAHPYASENAGKAAIARGPLVYCLEAADNPGSDLRDVVIPAKGEYKAEFRGDLLGGVVAVTGDAEVVAPADDWAGRLYRAAKPARKKAGAKTSVTAIPYYAWANRDPGRMQVWTTARQARPHNIP
jgi:DUF1680 family protein